MKKSSIEIRKFRKKVQNFWIWKLRAKNARYRILTPGTRCTRLNFFLKSGYKYIRDFVFQNLAKFGGGQFDRPLRFCPERSGMAPKWIKRTENKLFWRIKQFRVWFWGFWDDFGGLKFSISTTIMGDHCSTGIKRFKVWFLGFWEDFWQFENFDHNILNGPPIVVVKVESFRPPKIVPNPKTILETVLFVKNTSFHPFEQFGGHPGPFWPKY